MSAPTFDTQAFAEALKTTRLGRSFRYLESASSTNDVARADAEAGAIAGHVVLADQQSHGRGSQGRVWESPPGTDLYFSIVERPALPLTQLPGLTLTTGLAVAEAIERASAQRTHIKWPNDVWIGQKKCSGILVESASTGQSVGPVILGIGVNVNRLEFPVELSDSATSVALAAHRGPLSREHLLADLLAAIERRVDTLVQSGLRGLIDEVRERLALLGERVHVEGYGIGTLDDLMPDGSLRLLTESGPRLAVAGTLRRA